MEMHEAKELAARVRRQRIHLRYSPHRYAAWLLGRAVGQGVPVRELKTSRHARLFGNPLVKATAARAPHGCLSRTELERAALPGTEVYRLGGATWGVARRRDWDPWWHQTSRPGANLVLLLNFSPQHNAAYRRALDPEMELPLVGRGHPHAQAPEITLAWVRVDVDVVRGEALVEEVQSDWIRDVGRVWDRVGRAASLARRDALVRRCFPRATFDGLDHYWSRVLAHHRSWWSEAALFAALWTLCEELAIRRIWYHTARGGAVRKRIAWRQPPRSLYEALPRRFGFERSDSGPALLKEPEDRGERLPWYRLEL